jgi:hypothetical protein
LILMLTASTCLNTQHRQLVYVYHSHKIKSNLIKSGKCWENI